MRDRTKEYINDRWWLLLIAGIVALLFGIATLFMPGVTLLLQISFFAAFILVWGIVELISGLSDIKTNNQWWLSAVIGLLLLGLGVYLIRNPDLTVTTFVLLLGWVLVIRGVFDIAVGLAVHKDTEMKLFRGILGVLGVIAGIVIWIYPVSGTLAFTWVLGLYALIAGSMMLSEAIVSRSLIDDLKDGKK